MSVETWKKEFYPEGIEDVVTAKDAIKHSLLKWRGLQKTYLKKHGLKITRNDDISDGEDFFNIDASSCALCELFEYRVCKECPIFIATGIWCGNGTTEDPWRIWKKDHNPKPMIQLLTKLDKKYGRDRKATK